MSDTVFIIFMFSLVAANIVFCIWVLSGDKRDKKDVGTILKASDDMITGLERFMDSFPKMTEEFVSDVTPAIDSYIKERVEAYIQASAVVMPTVTDFQEQTPIQSRPDNAKSGSSTYGEEGDRDNPMPQELSSEEIESAFEAVPIADLYKDAFLHETENPFRTTSGKQVCIRKGYHRVITMLLESAECPCSTITGFIDNVLSDHFNMNRDSIEAIITSRYVNQKSL